MRQVKKKTPGTELESELLQLTITYCLFLRFFVFYVNFFKNVAKLKAKGLHQENDLNKLRVIVKKQHEELQTSADNVLNLSGELREKGEEMAQIEEQNLQ